MATGKLIDLDEEIPSSLPAVEKPSQSLCELNTSVSASEKTSQPLCKVESSVPAIEKTSQHLCGFLTKLSTGLIKSSKSRWFMFRPDTCELLYYRSQNADINDFDGKIQLRRASFNFAASDIKDNIFTINADGATHMLQASDKQTLRWWLQGLQEQRRLFNMSQNTTPTDVHEWPGCLLGQSIFWIPNHSDINPGLLKIGPENPTSAGGDSGGLSMLLDVQQLQLDSSSEKSRTSSLLSTSLSSKFPKLGGINNVLSNAGEALKSQANKLLPSSSARRYSECCVDPMESSHKLPTYFSTGNLSPTAKDSNYLTFIANLKARIEEMQLEIDLLKTTLQSKEEAVQSLMRDLQKYEAWKDQERTFSKDDYKLRSELIGLKLEKERLEQEKEEGLVREHRLKGEISMFEETIEAKDQLVRNLGLKLDELEKKLEKLQNEHVQLKAEKSEEFVVLTPTDAVESFTELKRMDARCFDYLLSAVKQDRAEGYMMQNQLLNTEIAELAQLRQHDAQTMHEYQDKIQLGEANYLRLHSKYLILLSEMNKPSAENVGLAVAGKTIASTNDEDRRALVKGLIREAIQDDDALSSSSGYTYFRGRKYDQYGFNNLPDDDTESMLLATASQLEKRSAEIEQSVRKFNVAVAVKWQNYLTLYKELQRCDEVKNLIRLGVPHELRPQVWSWMVQVLTSPIRQKLELSTSYYQSLAASKKTQLHSKQIELDLLRTLPNNKHFSSLSSFGIQQLRRVLLAYSIHNPSIGYCQGLNRIAAVALLYLREEEAFWCLVAIVEYIMPPDYYSNTLTASQADQRVFRDLLAEKLPRLHKHLENLGVDSSLITFNWLLCVYCDNVPPDTMLHIWDCFLYEGSKVLFRFGLAFFKHVEDELLQLTDYIAIFNFMRIMSHRMHDVRELTQLAFLGMNPFPMRKINRLRQIHMEKVTVELRELDELRRGYAGTRREDRRDLDSDED